MSLRVVRWSLLVARCGLLVFDVWCVVVVSYVLSSVVEVVSVCFVCRRLLLFVCVVG